MTPGARVAAAIAVLDRVLAGAPAEKCLTAWARGARYAGSADRAMVRDHVYQALRCRRSCACLGGAATGRAIMLGLLRAQGADPEAVFTGEGHAPKPLTQAERAAGHAPVAAADRLDLPDWLLAAFEDSLGDEAVAAARALRGRAPVILRADMKIKNRSQVIDILHEDGIEAAPLTIADSALDLREGARRLRQSRAWREGLVEIQDGSGQAAMALIELIEGARVLDYCAGGGGKVLALAARARGRGRWFAHDAQAGRMRDLPARAARAGVRVTLLPPGGAAAQAPYDVVLCDVPCSGSGTWRRTPDAKWKLTPETLDALCATQQSILGQAAALVRRGGVLAYSTCSVLKSENEAPVRQFLAAHPEWRLRNERRWPIGPQGDGFYLAQLVQEGKGSLQP